MRIFINQPFKCFCIFMWISQKRIFDEIYLSFLQIPSVVHSEFSACSFPLSPVKVTLSLPFSLRFPLFLTRSVPALLMHGIALRHIPDNTYFHFLVLVHLLIPSYFLYHKEQLPVQWFSFLWFLVSFLTLPRLLLLL